jgi:anti-sigma B factor antagonist
MADGRIDGFAAEVVHGDRGAVIVVRGEIDLATAPAFRAALDEALDGAGRVEVDLRDTSFMDSSGLAALLAAHRRLGPSQALVLRNPTREVRLALDISGLDALLDIRTNGNGAGREGDRT